MTANTKLKTYWVDLSRDVTTTEVVTLVVEAKNVADARKRAKEMVGQDDSGWEQQESNYGPPSVEDVIECP